MSQNKFADKYREYYQQEGCLCCQEKLVDNNKLFSSVWTDDFTEKRDVFSCNNCGIGYTYPFLTAEQEQKLYSDYPAHHSYENIIEDKIDAVQKIRVKFDDFVASTFFAGKNIMLKKILSSFLFPRMVQTNPIFSAKSKMKILDVGCGDGHFLSKAQKFNHECYGTEYTEKVITKLKEKGVKAFATLDEIIANNDEINSFDIVRINHVLEHVKDPGDVLSKAQKLLAKDGELIIGCPNFNTAAKMFKEFFWMHLPYHRQHFSIKSLIDLLACQGFDVVYAKTKSIGIFSSSFLRKHKKLKYSAVLRIFDLVLSMFLDAIRLGDCIEIYARKASDE